MCRPTSFDMRLCEMIIDPDNNLPAPGRMSITGRERMSACPSHPYSSKRCSLTRPPKLERPQPMFYLNANRLKNNGVCWKHATAAHAWLSRGKILTSHVARSAPITFRFTFVLFDRQTTQKRSFIFDLNCLSNQFPPPCVFLFRSN